MKQKHKLYQALLLGVISIFIASCNAKNDASANDIQQ